MNAAYPKSHFFCSPLENTFWEEAKLHTKHF